MTGTKSILLSRTFWGALLAIVAAVAGMFGYTVSADDQSAVLDLVNQVFAVWDKVAIIAGAALAIYGRVAATKTVVVKKPKA